MKLLVPYVGELQAVDARLIQLAEFLGIASEAISLERAPGNFTEYLEKAVFESRHACFVVNPRVMEEWVGKDSVPHELVSYLEKRFSHLLVHALRPKSFDSDMLAKLSGGHLHAVEDLNQAEYPYEISAGSRDVCDAFAGLSFGKVNPANDGVFSTELRSSAARTLISIAGRPFMASTCRENTRILFLAGKDVMDLTAEVGDAPLTDYFSRFLPHAMALRHIFGEESWRPYKQNASVIIDDPILQRDYGFLNFESLLRLLKQYKFHTTIAFIPHNYRRTSMSMASLFTRNANCLSLCFHGNDHTGAEFASPDTALLNTMLQVAEHRMKVHKEKTGIGCARVMVFPQGKFSVEAMAVLKSRNFDSAVNTTPYPSHQPVCLTLAELAQPAVLRYAGFPLFLRKNCVHTQCPDIAFNLFFGRPVLIVEHHDVFRDPGSLAAAATRINSTAPEIQWSNLTNALNTSMLKRLAPDGTVNIRAYSRTVRISNESHSAQRFLIEWNCSGNEESPRQLLKDGTTDVAFKIAGAGIQMSIELTPWSSHTFSLANRNVHPVFKSLGVRRAAKAVVRRRLSEMRDNYLSKYPSTLAVAKTVQRHLLQ